MFGGLGGLFGGDDGGSAAEIAAMFPDPIGFNTTTGAGTTTFTPGTKGGTSTYSTTLNPVLQDAQDRFFGIGTGALDELKDYDSKAFATDYLKRLNELRRPEWERQEGQTRDRLNLSGRSGFFTGSAAQLDSQRKLGLMYNPEMMGFYGAREAQMAKDALMADQMAFSRFNDILARAGGSFGKGFGVEAPLQQTAQMVGSLNNQVNNAIMQKGQLMQQAMLADASEDDGGGFFDDLLSTGLSFGLDYLSGGATGGLGGIFG